MLKYILQKIKINQPLVFIFLAISGNILNILATFPGYLYSDSRLILEEIESNIYNDWHSPFYIWMWKEFTKILPGPEFITLFNISGIWMGCLAISLIMQQRLGRKAGLFLLVPIMPGMLNLTGTVVIDTTMNVFFLLSIIFLLLAAKMQRADISKLFSLLSICSLIIVQLIRNNAFFAILPLLFLSATLFVKTASSRWAFVPVFIPALCGVLLAGPIAKSVIKPLAWHPIISLQVKHLQQLSYYEQKNLFPGTWSSEQEHRIMRSCYKFENWDNDAGWGHCGFIFDAMNQNENTHRALTQAWVNAIVTHPFSFFISSLPTYKLALFSPVRQTMMFNWVLPGRNISWQDQEPHHQKLHMLHKKYVESQFNLGLGKPYMGLAISCVGLLICFATRRKFDFYDQIFCTLIFSGILYLLTFMPINVATEYRYYLWGLLAAELGTLYVILSLFGPVALNFSKKAFPPFIKIVISVAMALLITTKLFSYPQETRIFTITPVGDAPTRILYLREDIDKFWTDAFEGHPQAPDWNADGNGYLSRKESAPFTMSLTLPYQDAALGYATGPDFGSFRVCVDATCQTVEAHAATAGERTLIFSGNPPPITTHFTLKWVGLFLGLILAFYGLCLPGLLLIGRLITRRASSHTA